jgi:DNA-binding response OmpR family regulator
MQHCVVIADDDPAVITLVRMRLEMARYTVVVTHNALSALEMVRAKKPVAVILDVQMPGGGALPGGLSALAEIKADPQLSGVPVMMLTGERNAEIVLQAMTGGADDYMVKPFIPDTLLERLERMIRAANGDQKKTGPMMWGEPAKAASAAVTWEL